MKSICEHRVFSVVDEKSLAKLDPVDCIWKNGFEIKKERKKEMQISRKMARDYLQQDTTKSRHSLQVICSFLFCFSFLLY